jgi:glycerol-3-phosphate dehydrogenase (NAD(P)+)
MKIAILGAGAYGTALGQVLSENGYEIQYYDPALENTSLDKVLDGAMAIVVTVPSAALDTTLIKLPKNIPLIIGTKGILNTDILSGFGDVMVLSGPGFANDIKAHLPTLLTTNDQRVAKIFTTDYLKFDYSDDMRGILLCGALKNAYAILAGLLDLRPGTIEHEEFLSAVIDEIKILLEANGANKETAELACGKDDLRITCGMPSRNYEFGQKLRQNPQYLPEKTVEGVTVIKEILNGGLVVPDSAKKMQDLLKRSEAWN